MRLGSAAHKAIEDQLTDAAVLKSKGLGDLQAVFASEDWRAIADLPIERELPFIMHVQASGKDCFVRGRMDAVVPGDPPRVIDYKFALWKEGAEVGVPDADGGLQPGVDEKYWSRPGSI